MTCTQMFIAIKLRYSSNRTQAAVVILCFIATFIQKTLHQIPSHLVSAQTKAMFCRCFAPTVTSTVTFHLSADPMVNFAVVPLLLMHSYTSVPHLRATLPAPPVIVQRLLIIFSDRWEPETVWMLLFFRSRNTKAVRFCVDDSFHLWSALLVYGMKFIAQSLCSTSGIDSAWGYFPSCSLCVPSFSLHCCCRKLASLRAIFPF